MLLKFLLFFNWCKEVKSWSEFALRITGLNSSRHDDEIEAFTGDAVCRAHTRHVDVCTTYTACSAFNSILSNDGLRWHHHHTTTVLRPFFRQHPGEPVPAENLWTLWCKRRLTDADTPPIRLTAERLSIRTNQCPPPPPLQIFYRPDALPAAQPTASKHSRQLAHSD